MHRRGSAVAFSVLAAFGVLASAASAQRPPPATDPSARHAPADRFAAPRTPWGDPDLQGTWPSDQLVDVPFERDPAFGTRNELTDVELAAARVVAQSDNSPGTAPPPHWLERGKVSRQASLVVDPPNGRLPALTEDGARRAARWRETSAPDYPFRGPADLTPYDRCISRGVLGSAFPNLYNTGMQIMQAPGLVVIRYEMIHETRVIPLEDRPRLGPALRSYLGDAEGRWDRDTLVVETTNFNGRTGSYGRNGNGNPTSGSLRLVESFTLVDANTLQYRVTVHDPETWAGPWSVGFSLARDDAYTLYEYACHEGNYAMANILKGARARER